MLIIGMRQRQVIVLRDTSLRDGIHPVGIRETHGLLLIDKSIIATINGIILILACGWVPYSDRCTSGSIQVNTIVGSVSHRVLTIVQGSLSHSGGILGRIEQLHLRLVGIELCSHISREVDGNLITLLTLLGSDDDNTIRRTRTIDRSRSSILQHLHTLNIICIKRVQGIIGRHTIYNIKRILRRIERTNTTDTYGTSTNRRTCGGNGHTWHTTLQGTHWVGISCCLQVFGRYHSHRTSQVGLALCSITCNNHLTQLFGIVLQHYLHIIRSLHFLGLAT